ncbi:adenylate/guanylate cyclase domain-containing protein [Candidatus Odyssella thessalonicensis]|uniref:adenylate/guanylate cyclase domain-containing protein n=1 Tax=Candidatus Odyssella thessalonicensis TaxID=84647 RepID=UPI0004968563|nr:adenylate/guanylate cyclase domain-containing protein [Candidatus Odyssella thessalonicensis]
MQRILAFILKWVKKFVQQRNLRFDILSSFFVIQILTASSIVYYTYTNNSKSILELAQKMMEDLSESKIDRIRTRFDGVQTSVLMGSYILKNPQSINTQNKILLDYSIAVVRQYPFVESIFIGTETGNFLQVKILPPNSTYRSNQRLLPKKAKIAVRMVERSGHDTRETWSYFDDDSKILETEELPPSQVLYNHKVREWYQRALQTRSQIWTSIYIFSTTGLPGVANATPLSTYEGQYFGVIGSDIPLDGFTEILKNIHFEGLSLILTKKGEIVASPFEERPARVSFTAADTQLRTVKDLTNKLPAEAFRLYQTNNLDKFIFTYENQTYIASFKEYDTATFKDWIYVFIMPIDTLIGEIKQTQQDTLIISFVIFILSIIFITYLAHRISRPIIQLSQQANRISSFDLSYPEQVHSGIKELQQLQQSINTMRTSLVSFGKYVPKKLVRTLLDKGEEVKIGGKSKKITIMFTDIADFTTISETYPADKLVNHLSEYFEELTQIIDSVNGTVDKFIGDAIMSFWGAPNIDREQAMHACTAALLCQKRLNDLNRKWNFEKKPLLNTRIGIHCGEAIVGNMGASWRMIYSVLGDNVNLAARLEGLNKYYHTSVIISEDVYHQIQDDVVARPLDIVAVKGKKKGIKIYELIALKNSNSLLLPCDKDITFCARFDRAVYLYRDKRWDEAIEQFMLIEQEYGKDYTAQLYIDRCNYYKKNPPPPNWDGVFIASEK